MNPHLDQPALRAGAPLEGCRLAVVLLHGRGRTPEEMIGLAERLALPGLAYLAPAAADQSWYPLSFLEPLERNQPRLGQALEALDARVAELRGAGLPLERIALAGFSQGACLAAEYAARRPGPYAGLVIWTGGLIGPRGTAWPAAGDLAGAPVLVSGAEQDSWVPAWRMAESAEHLGRLGARARLMLYPGDSHIVSEAELAAARELLGAAAP